jgi:hypothetical protein
MCISHIHGTSAVQTERRKLAVFFFIHLAIEEFDTHFVSRYDWLFGIGSMRHKCFFSCEIQNDLHNKIHLEKANIQASYLLFSTYFVFWFQL